MTSHPSHPPVSALRERMIEDMVVRGFNEKTRTDYVRNVRTFSAFIGRSPATATAEEVRRFQLHQTETGVGTPSINSAVSALRFLFSVTLDRPDLARRLTVVRRPRKLPLVLSAKEVALVLEAAPGPKYNWPAVWNVQVVRMSRSRWAGTVRRDRGYCRYPERAWQAPASLSASRGKARTRSHA